MRIQFICVRRWRHFENIEIVVPDDAPVVCLIGGNGTGKSQLLELVAACALQIGISQGYSAIRGNPTNEDANFEVRFYIAQGTVGPLDPMDPLLALPVGCEGARENWDRTITVIRDGSNLKLIAGGIPPQQNAQFVQWLVTVIRNSESVHYLMLDADRAYPKIEVQAHEFGGAFETDWEGSKKARSFALTKNLYEEWFRFLLGTESRENNRHISDIRRAREVGATDPVFVDHFKPYKESLQKILPHLLFTGVASSTRQIEFDSTGIALNFSQLSGGEREIAFLVGQIERFGLTRGLLLVDEPELHLNYDLLRSWIGFLKDTVELGQIWLATHSLEVVEVAGQAATFLLERDEVTRKVRRASTLADRPVVSTLSRAVGSPAFSVSNLTFVLLEGEEAVGERERFRLLTNVPRDVRFMESGGCREVVRKLATLKDLAIASGESLRLGGVVDRDWRSQKEVISLEEQGIFVLPVHEVENFYLHPPTIIHFLEIFGRNSDGYSKMLIAAADGRAGTSIFHAARTDERFKDFPPPAKNQLTLAHETTWSDFEEIDSACRIVAEADSELTADQSAMLAKYMVAQAKIYARKRDEDTFWTFVEGKEIFRSIVPHIGFANAAVAEAAIAGLWSKGTTLIPEGLLALREYVNGLRLS